MLAQLPDDVLLSIVRLLHPTLRGRLRTVCWQLHRLVPGDASMQAIHAVLTSPQMHTGWTVWAGVVTSYGPGVSFRVLARPSGLLDWNCFCCEGDESTWGQADLTVAQAMERIAELPRAYMPYLGISMGSGRRDTVMRL